MIASYIVPWAVQMLPNLVVRKSNEQDIYYSWQTN
jgi:hypothetical protein